MRLLPLASCSLLLSSCFFAGYETNPSRDASPPDEAGAADASSSDASPWDRSDAAGDGGRVDAQTDAAPARDADIDATLDASRDAGRDGGRAMDAGRDATMDGAMVPSDAASDGTVPLPDACVGLACGPLRLCDGGNCALSCTAENLDAGLFDCNFQCRSGSTCETSCETDLSCQTSCSQASCNTVCAPGAACTMQCVDSDCRGECMPGSTCTFVCFGSDCNEFICHENSSCIIYCPRGGSCDFEDCHAFPERRTCDNGTVVCGRSCPEDEGDEEDGNSGDGT